MCRFVGLMLGSGEGHFCQFISSRPEKNINTTHPLQGVQCVDRNLQGKTLGRGSLECEQLNFSIQDLKTVVFYTLFVFG